MSFLKVCFKISPSFPHLGVSIENGLLYYMKKNEMVMIPTVHGELRALIIQRNTLAKLLTENKLAPLLKDTKFCSKCDFVDACLIHHKVASLFLCTVFFSFCYFFFSFSFCFFDFILTLNFRRARMELRSPVAWVNYFPRKQVTLSRII